MINIKILKTEQIKQNVIIRISILVSLLISVPRILSFYDITDQLNETITESSYLDITIRFVAILLFSWFSLQFNSNWRHFILIKSRLLNVLVILFSNTILTYIGVNLLFYIYPIIVGADIGTTVTGWLLLSPISKYGLPMMGFTAFFFLFSKNERIRYTAMMILGLGMVFFGMMTMKDGFYPLREMAGFRDFAVPCIDIIGLSVKYRHAVYYQPRLDSDRG